VVTLRWRVDDTGTKAGLSPVLRIQARAKDGRAAPMVFPGGTTYHILDSGNGTHATGLRSNRNPGNLADINHLQIRVQNGTAEEIYHWMRAHNKPGKQFAKSVSPAELKVGDLLFFDRTTTSGRDATHVAFWAGDNTLFHAFDPDVPIGYTSYTPYFRERLVGAFRVLGVETVSNG
jgi:hypothetical protein